jgi:REP-associated tyrosine transposase
LIRRKKNRLAGYDYSRGGCYFVTICLKDKRKRYLSDIINCEVKLNEFGNIVEYQWLWLQGHFEYVILDVHVIMPNHFHGIIAIDDFVGNGRDRSPDLKIKSISSLLGAFKTTSSKFIHQNGLLEFKWQKSFHDRIIRNENEFYNIQRYIFENPARWDYDIENGYKNGSNEEYYNNIFKNGTVATVPYRK